MPSWLVSLAAVFAGLLVAVVLMTLVQGLSVQLFPLPPGVDPSDPAALAQFMQQLPVGALLLVALSYALGSLGAGVGVALVARLPAYWLAGFVGVLLTIAGFFNLAAIPHPTWFAVLTTCTYVPCALLGARATVAWRARRGAGAAVESG